MRLPSVVHPSFSRNAPMSTGAPARSVTCRWLARGTARPTALAQAIRAARRARRSRCGARRLGSCSTRTLAEPAGSAGRYSAACRRVCARGDRPQSFLGPCPRGGGRGASRRARRPTRLKRLAEDRSIRLLPCDAEGPIASLGPSARDKTPSRSRSALRASPARRFVR